MINATIKNVIDLMKKEKKMPTLNKFENINDLKVSEIDNLDGRLKGINEMLKVLGYQTKEQKDYF